jgi:MFS superfamily sulfate permease-like transporter
MVNSAGEPLTVPLAAGEVAERRKRTPRWQDTVAGLCVAGLLIPEAVAYAGLAGLPVVHALTALVMGLAVYGVLGGSRFAIVAPTSSTATLAAAAATSMTGPAGSTVGYTETLLALVLLMGAALVLLGLARQGQLSAFVSRPVLRGFAFALAITIVIKQLPDALGLTLPSGTASDPLSVLLFAATHVGTWHLASVGVAAAAALTVTALRRWPWMPASMVVIVLAILGAGLLDLHSLGIAEVGSVERPGLHAAIPVLPRNDWATLLELAFGLVVLVFAESWGSIRNMALAHGDTVDANRELMVLGTCNLAAGLLQGMPVGAGFSATSANAAAGATTRWAGLFALAVVLVVIAVALPAVHLLPRPVLAVAVITALWHALNPRPLADVWRMRRDRTLLTAGILAVLVFGVMHGMLLAIGLSIVDALRRFSRPVVRELGQLGSSRDFVVLAAHPGVAAVPGVLILRPEEPLFFASTERVVAEIGGRLRSHPSVHTLILSLEESADLDSTAVECLLELDARLHSSGKRLLLARVKDPVRELLSRFDPKELGAPERSFWSVADAVDAARHAST